MLVHTRKKQVNDSTHLISCLSLAGRASRVNFLILFFLMLLPEAVLSWAQRVLFGITFSLLAGVASGTSSLVSAQRLKLADPEACVGDGA